MGFLANVSRRGQRWPAFTIRGWGFLAASIALFVLAPMLGQREIAFAASASLALPLLALLLVSVRRPKLTVVRRFSPETANAGAECEVSLSVQNWGIATTPAALWHDEAASPLISSPTDTLPPLPAFRSLETGTPRVTTARYLIESPRRGQHEVGPLWIRFSDPFGLATRRFAVGGTDVLTVTPDVETLSRGSFRLPSGDGQSMQSRRPSASGEQDVIARKYQTGDSIRRVHWPATARHSELMVRQDDQHTDHEAVIVLDNRLESFAHDRRGRAGETQSEAFEWAVSMSVSIGMHLLGEGYRTVFVESADPAAPHSGERSAGEPAELLLRGARARLGAGHLPLAVRDIVADAGHGSGELPPLFAVLGDVDAESLDALSRAATASSSALAFIVHDVPPTSQELAPEWARRLREHLMRAGWTARLVSPVDTPSSAWEPDTARLAR
ncbi:DUF58 domain-containing protein [Agreia bicolorata]|uniref:DUF58 domain-containing protein n=1 Tax=Agreia bicolorata TaxID=110935 RepID=A0ABR5CIF4_9MICO|nr:DUF58 domain-containing protein [Agreia bicolorata]KJC65427.1 hypothetical protein TZ00_00660 [Agreia bicolorata]